MIPARRLLEHPESVCADTSRPPLSSFHASATLSIRASPTYRRDVEKHAGIEDSFYKALRLNEYDGSSNGEEKQQQQQQPADVYVYPPAARQSFPIQSRSQHTQFSARYQSQYMATMGTSTTSPPINAPLGDMKVVPLEHYSRLADPFADTGGVRPVHTVPQTNDFRVGASRKHRQPAFDPSPARLEEDPVALSVSRHRSLGLMSSAYHPDLRLSYDMDKWGEHAHQFDRISRVTPGSTSADS